MISDFRQTLSKSFLQDISEEGLFGKWNKNKTIFELKLEADVLFNEYTDFYEDINGDYYAEYFLECLCLLKETGVKWLDLFRVILL